MQEVIQIAKSDLTIKLERAIWDATHKQGTFCCFEVTIGWFGKERVDYITYNTNGEWRFYEIKSSKSDFNSEAKHTFLGHFNYYVMTKELYEQIKDEIPKGIGVYLEDRCFKRAKKQELGIDEEILKNSFIRSLYREAEKIIKSENPNIINVLNRRLSSAERDTKSFKKQYQDLRRKVEEKYGTRWDK